jgi:hypothetical protein
MAESPSWKPGHPGVPSGWQLLGEGGNALVWSDGVQAIKRLKPNSSGEARARFVREAEVMRLAQPEPTLRVVRLHEIRDREGSAEIVMERLTGNLENIIGQFKGQPRKAARALKPVVDTLAALARREHPIHHRDLKPTNLLYKDDAEALCVADFGCAYLSGDARLTPQHRAMGAFAYRPPEYVTGRVEEVSEKGDVFSLGKVFWAMVNGEPKAVFPDAHWYLPEYDLFARFGPSSDIHHAMLLVAAATAVRPDERPTLQELSERLGALGSATATESQADMAELLHAQELIEVRHAQRRASGAIFIRATHADLLSALERLRSRNTAVRIWQEWYKEAVRTPQTADALVQQTAEQESDATAVVCRFRGLSLVARYLPAGEGNTARLMVQLASEQRREIVSTLWVVNAPSGLTSKSQLFGSEQRSGQYAPDQLEAFLLEATRIALSEMGLGVRSDGK